jgi:hypothetical protein
MMRHIEAVKKSGRLKEMNKENSLKLVDKSKY